MASSVRKSAWIFVRQLRAALRRVEAGRIISPRDEANDPLPLAAAVLTMAAATLLAGYVPTHNAPRIDPMAALGHE